jgi:hypothetical protein
MENAIETLETTARDNPLPDAEVYARLAAPFDGTFKDVRGGIDLEYITGEQAITRLNEVLGVTGWSFRVLEHGFHPEADEFWVLAEISARIGDSTLVRQQFGSQKMKRYRTTDSPLDVGFDLKGATTDALKKTASLLGVGLYLSRKEAQPDPGQNGSGERRLSLVGESQTGDSPLFCEECDQELREVRFRDGTSWAPLQLASYGRRKHGRVLCMEHYREANATRKRAEEALAVGSNLDEAPSSPEYAHSTNGHSA